MGERENAMAQSRGNSLMLYSEGHRDQVERELANKREINRRTNNGITVVAYWMMQEQVAIIFVHDARTNGAAEYEVDSAEVMEEFLHPFANANSWGVTEQQDQDGA